MAELGDESLAAHARSGLMARSSGVKRLFTVGSDATAALATFGSGGKSFKTLDALIKHIKKQLKPAASSAASCGVSLLVKGSRAAHMEHLVAALTLPEKTQ